MISSSEDTPHIFMVSSSSVPILSMYARTPSALPPYTAVTNGLAIRTPSAPSARALKTSVPLLMPPSTRILMPEPSKSLYDAFKHLSSGRTLIQHTSTVI